MDFRKLLDIITENEAKGKSPFSGKTPAGIEIMTLDDFIEDEAPEDSSDDQDVDRLQEAEEKFGLGASLSKMSLDDMKSYLDSIIARTKSKKDRVTKPYIHRSNVVPIKDEAGNEYDYDRLRKMFTQRPAKLLKQNDKMKHSDGTASVFYNIGLPALRGLAVDEKTGDFYVVNTCPGAGKCIKVCFAMSGGYIQWAASSLSLTQMLNYLLNAPDEFMSQLKREVTDVTVKNAKKGNKTFIRWHDAGDFFSPAYLEKAYSVARSIPDATFYAYTKVADVAKGAQPENFIINFSMGAKPAEEKRIDFKKHKHSTIVPTAIFKDLTTREKIDTGKKDKKGNPKIISKLVYSSPAAIQTLKNRLAKLYMVDPKSILTYDEMLKTPKGQPLQYNVIVKPGDGDISAARRDVLGTYLLEH